MKKMKLTTAQVLSILEQDQTYMVCPYNEQTLAILEDGWYLNREADKQLEIISDKFEKTPDGANFQVQEVETFGVVEVEDVVEYEPYHEAYFLILVKDKNYNRFVEETVPPQEE